jgi:hypothetical protein
LLTLQNCAQELTKLTGSAEVRQKLASIQALAGDLLPLAEGQYDPAVVPLESDSGSEPDSGSLYTPDSKIVERGSLKNPFTSASLAH